MTDEQFESLFGPSVLVADLKKTINEQPPMGVHEDVGLVMDVEETVTLIQVWQMKHYALMRTCTFARTKQYLQATANVNAVAQLNLAAIGQSLVE